MSECLKFELPRYLWNKGLNQIYLAFNQHDHLELDQNTKVPFINDKHHAVITCYHFLSVLIRDVARALCRVLIPNDRQTGKTFVSPCFSPFFCDNREYYRMYETLSLITFYLDFYLSPK